MDQLLSDEELAELLGMDHPNELYEGIAGDGGKIYINTCAGQWIKYDILGAKWSFNEDREWSE